MSRSILRRPFVFPSLMISPSGRRSPTLDMSTTADTQSFHLRAGPYEVEQKTVASRNSTSRRSSLRRPCRESGDRYDVGQSSVAASRQTRRATSRELASGSAQQDSFVPRAIPTYPVRQKTAFSLLMTAIQYHPHYEQDRKIIQ